MEPWRRLDQADTEKARELLSTCCGAQRWVERMIERRPFRDRDTLLAAARDEWFALSAADWREAFTHHPKIGDAPGQRFVTTRHFSQKEQAGVDSASDATISALADGNRAYEARFGHIFIVCATGKTGEDMLALLRIRMRNDPESEIRIAADEQAKITEIRLLSLHEQD